MTTRVLLTLAGLLLLGALVLATAPLLRIPLDAVAMVGAFDAYAVVPAVLSLVAVAGAVVAGSPRRWLLVPLVIVLVLLVVQAPHWIASNRPAAGPSVTVMSMNVEFGFADADAIVAATADADVVALTEMTNGAVRRLAAAGLERRFGYRLEDVVLPDRGAQGTMIYSRWPLAEATDLLPGSQLQNWRTSVEVPGFGRLEVVAVHARRPLLTDTRWLGEHDAIAQALPREPRTVVAGDFNATDAQLRTPGYLSAADVLGRGGLRTFPAGSTIPPLIRIDHVLLGSGLTATALDAVPIPRTDHLALRAVIAARA